MIRKLDNTNETMRVLVIDDEQGIREGCERILKRMGFEVFKANRGDKGLEVVEQEDISIVLLDLKMPGMDGMEVLPRIREMDDTILVIIITGFATIETAIEAMKQGAYDFIPKPFEPDHLRIVVDRARENLRLTRETEKLEEERKKTLLDLGTEKSRIRTIIESLPNGILVTNSQGQVVFMNPAFQQMLDLDPCRPAGEPMEAYLSDEGFIKLVHDISQGKYHGTDEPPSYELALAHNVFYMARGKPVLAEDGECLGAVITLINITTMKVLDQLKNEFVAKVSHELRSPLSTIHEQLAMVLNDMVEGESAEEQYILSRAKEKTQGMISLIGDLLDLSRIESGAVTREPETVHVDEMMRNIVDFLQARAGAKKQSLDLELPDESLPTIIADPRGLESIFGNLISNAVNYTQEGGRIEVSVGKEGNRIVTRVADNGFGIEEKHQKKIFDRFFRVKNAKTRYITGTGLGLPIVKNLVDSMNGSITLESRPDVGTTFTVALPIEKVEAVECAEPVRTEASSA